MKNFILLLGIMLFAGMSYGQLKVVASGQTQINSGNMLVAHPDNGGRNQITGHDNSSNFLFALEPSTSGSLGFFEIVGTGGGARTGEFALAGRYQRFLTNVTSGGATRFGVEAMRINADGTVGVGTSSVAAGHLMQVNGNIMAAGGTVTTSDRRLKSNINDFDRGLEDILKIRTRTYNYNGKAGVKNNTKQFGVVAQEIEKIAPELVGTYIQEERDINNELVKSEEFKYVNTGALTYMLINAIQDQQEIIVELQGQIDELKSSIASIDNISNSDDVDLVDVAQSTLMQNSPNPYNEGTVISYSVAENATSAKMNFYNLTGQLIKSVSLQSGAGKLNVSADELPSGTYTYSLEVDGALISNKKMVKMK